LSCFELQKSSIENRDFFQFKTAHSSNYRGRLFFCLRQGVVLNLCHLDFDIVSDFELRISSLWWICSTFVENSLQITPFYAKQTQFYPFLAPKRRFFEKQTQFQTQLLQRPKLMQSVYFQRIMKKNADMGYEKTKPKQTQNKANFKRDIY